MRFATILGPALGALAGGVVAALLTVWIVAPAAPTKKKTSKAGDSIAAEAPASDLEGRVEALERAVGRLGRRSLTPGIAASGQAPGTPGVEADATQRGDAPIIDDPVFEAAVRDVIQRIDEERDSDRELERSERRKQRVEQWSSALTEKLKLTDQQRAKVAEIATHFWQSVRDMRDSDAGPQGRDARRAKMEELRQAAETRLGEVLDGRQMQSYRELDEEERLGQRSWRGRGPRDRERESESNRPSL